MKREIRPRNAPRLTALASAAALACAALAAAGPVIPCPDGPDPLRFRREISLAPSGQAPSSFDGGVLDVAAAVDPADGREWIALAYLTPAQQLAVVASANGGLTFGSSSGGFGPVLVDPAGPTAAAPRLDLRVDGGVPLVAVAWRAGDVAVGALRVAVAPDASGTFQVAQLDADGVTKVAHDVAVVPGPGPRRVLIAWLDDGLGTPLLRVRANEAEGAPTGWAPPTTVPPPAGEAFGRPFVMRQLAMAADSAPSAAAGATIAVVTESTSLFAARSGDGGLSFGPWTRLVDSVPPNNTWVAADAGRGGHEAWTAVSWWRWDDVEPGYHVKGDAALATASTVDPGFQAELGGPSSELGPVGGTAPLGVAVAGQPPGRTVFASAMVFEGAIETGITRRLVSATGERLSGGCPLTRVTGVDPPRTTGHAMESAIAAIGDDVAIGFIDTRTGSRRVWFKRSDSVAPAFTGLTATAARCGSLPGVLLQWSPAPPADAVSATVEVGLAPGGRNFVEPAAIGTSHFVDGLAPGTTFWFRVRVLDSAGNEGVTPEASATTPTCPGPTPRRHP